MTLLLVIAGLLAAAQGHGQDHSGHGGGEVQAPSALRAPDRAAIASLPAEGGHSAFAAISEVAAMLASDPDTDWSRVNIAALREHLVDMDNVTLRARVTATPVPGGARFLVSGDASVRDSVRRMTEAHAATTDGSGAWRMAVEDTGQGTLMTITSDSAAGAEQIRALGFFGALTTGAHHPLHHMMIARGEMQH